MKLAECDHYAVQVVEGAAPRSEVCEECGLDRPLRVCMTCGHVGCCESFNKHDTIHWQETGHAIIRRLPLVETSFTYCYEHQAYLEA